MDNELSTPRPDPTILTTEQLLRAISAVEAVFDARFDGHKMLIDRLRIDVDAVPERIDFRIEHLRDLDNVKFESIQTQFTERDTRTESTARDSKLAVDAALQAAKEAVAKSEGATIKLLDQLGLQIQSSTKVLDDKIFLLNERMTRSEGKGQGTEATNVVHQTTSSYVVALIVAVLLFVSVSVNVVVALKALG